MRLRRRGRRGIGGGGQREGGRVGRIWRLWGGFGRWMRGMGEEVVVVMGEGAEEMGEVEVEGMEEGARLVAV